MPNYPLVSIVTPLYNQLPFIQETIESLLSQTYSRIECIVVNDGSNDGSRELLDRYRHKLKIIDQENKGQAHALNRGWSISQGKYIGYLSSDDILAPECVEAVVAALEADSDIVCAYPNCNLISPASKVLKYGVCRSFDLEKLIVEQSCHIGPGALWRASAHQEVGGWKPELKLAPDREYWIRLSAHGKFYFKDEILAGYRLHPQSISASLTSEKASLEYIHVLDEYFAEPCRPKRIVARKNEAYGKAYWLIARNMLRQGCGWLSWRYLRLAYTVDPTSINLKNFTVMARVSIGKPLRLLIGRAIRIFEGK